MGYAGYSIVKGSTGRQRGVDMVSADLPPPVVPDEIAIVRDFVNTTDHETQTDDITTTAELSRYLFDAGLLTRRSRATVDDLELARTLRAGLRRALELNHDGEAATIPELDHALSLLPCELHWVESGAELVPTREGVPGALTRVVIAMNQAMAADRWWRLKICSSDECEWAYYDKSKNRSARWCEYGCGDRMKMRAYRARQRTRTAAG
jgi:predicted RNA-binding Zn ribbon-like protein